MISRRNFLHRGAQAGIAAATAPLWSNIISTRALAQSASNYKAVVVLTLAGGCDGNNVLIPLDSATYAQYAKVRGTLALSPSQTIPLTNQSGAPTYGLHSALKNVAAMYNSKLGLVVANVGPMVQPATKQQLLVNSAIVPQSLLSHMVQRGQWESADVIDSPATGWGGRIADIITSQSGKIEGVLNAGPNSIFTVGNSVQGVAVQGIGATAIPPDLNSIILQIAQNDTNSPSALVAQAAKFRAAAMQEQVILNQAAEYGTLKTQFINTGFGATMQTIANIINGRSVLGASKQVFYAQQGNGTYDTHIQQIYNQGQALQELDAGLGNFFAALDEMGLTNQVLVCTHSDFSRTMTANTNGGTDHAWGNQQLVLGGGISGGRIVGTMPDMELGGACDYNTQGTWIPTTAVTQMTAGIGSWLGLSASQLSQVFPKLGNFPSGMIQF